MGDFRKGGLKVSLKDKIAKTIEEKGNIPTKLDDIYKEFPTVPQSTIRGRIYDNIGKMFDKLGEGMYILSGVKSTIGLLEGDARNITKYFDKESLDLIIADYPWQDEKSHKGGTRNFANEYKCFDYEIKDFKDKHFVLKNNTFLIEFLPEKNANNIEMLDNITRLANDANRHEKFNQILEYFEKNIPNFQKDYKNKLDEDSRFGRFDILKKIDEFKLIYGNYKEIFDSKDFKKLEKECKNSTGFEFYVDIPITGGNMNTGRKSSFISVVRIFKKGEPKLKVFDEKLSSDIVKSKNNVLSELKDIVLKEESKIKKGNELLKVKYEFININTFDELNNFILNNNISIDKNVLDDYKNKYLNGNTIFKYMKDGYRPDFKKVYLEILDLNEKLIFENFEDHVLKNELVSFKKFNKIKNIIEEINQMEIFPEERYEEYQVALNEYSNFKEAFNEYINWLKDTNNNYKSGSKSMFPEYFEAEKILKEEQIHQSQKPLNVISNLILQTSNTGAIATELFAGSFRTGEAIIELDKKGFGERVMIGIENDKEQVEKTNNYFKEKYKDIKFYNIDELRKELKGELNSNNSQKEYKNLINKIDIDLKDIIKIQETDDNFNYIEEYQGTTQSFNLKNENNNILKLEFLRNGKESENRFMFININKNTSSFEILNLNGKNMAKIEPGITIQELLIKIYNAQIEKLEK